MKIAFISSFPPKECGIADYSYYIVNNLVKLSKSLEIHVIAQKVPRSEITNDKQVFIHNCWTRSPFISHEITNVIRRIDPNIVHMQFQFGLYGYYNILSLVVLFNKLEKTSKFILTNHNNTRRLVEFVNDFFPIFARDGVLNSLNRFYFGKADKIVALNNEDAETLETRLGVKNELITVVEHGAPDMIPLNASECKRKLGLQDRYVLLLFGFIRPTKGYEYAIMALSSIVKKNPHVMLLIAGEPDPYEYASKRYVFSLTSVAKKLKLGANIRFDIQFIPKVKVPIYFNASDIVLLPYTKWGVTSSVMHIAFAYGKPIIATESHTTEIVKYNDLGIVVPPKNYEALVYATERLMENSNLYKKYEDNCKKWAHKHSWRNVAKQILHIYTSFRD